MMTQTPDHPYAAYFSRVINGVAYVNDCQATDVQASVRAIESFSNVYWIAGGQEFDSAPDALQSCLHHLRHVYLMGEGGKTLEKFLVANGVAAAFVDSIDIAVIEAHAASQLARGEPGGAGTVLLSPAMQPEDMFRSPEHLGLTFTEIVNNLSVEAPE